MEISRLVAPLLAALFSSLACAHVPRYEDPAPPKLGTLRVWVQADPNISAEQVLEGCRFWQPMGVQCGRVLRSQDADIRVSISYEPCLALAQKRLEATKAGIMPWIVPVRPECRIPFPKEGEKVTEEWGMLGLSYGNGDITLYPSCLAWSGSGMIVPAMVTRTAAHEVGHELGLDHVPVSCDDRCADYRLDADGAKICGPSIMNAPLPEIDYLTPADAAAFRARPPGRPPHRP